MNLNRTICLLLGTTLAITLATTGVSAANGLKQAPSGWVEDGSENLSPADQARGGEHNQERMAETRRPVYTEDRENLSAPQPALQRGEGSSGVAPRKGPMVLQGGVEHSQELPALPHSLSIGATYNEHSFDNLPNNHDWYWIPEWLAGDWRRDEETIVSTFNYQTGYRNNEPRVIAASEIAQFGVQRDKTGGVWHCRLATGGVADCGSYTSVAHLQTQEPLVVSQEYVVMRDVFTELHVNKETRAIIYSAQAESLTRYEPQPNGTLKVTTSVKIFDQNGSPKERQRNLSTTFRIKPFAPLNTYKGADLSKAFHEYLSSQGKQNLIP